MIAHDDSRKNGYGRILQKHVRDTGYHVQRGVYDSQGDIRTKQSRVGGGLGQVGNLSFPRSG